MVTIWFHRSFDLILAPQPDKNYNNINNSPLHPLPALEALRKMECVPSASRSAPFWTRWKDPVLRPAHEQRRYATLYLSLEGFIFLNYDTAGKIPDFYKELWLFGGESHISAIFFSFFSEKHQSLTGSFGRRESESLPLIKLHNYAQLFTGPKQVNQRLDTTCLFFFFRLCTFVWHCMWNPNNKAMRIFCSGNAIAVAVL